VLGTDLAATSAMELEKMAAQIDRAYGPCCDEHLVMNVLDGQGTLDAIADFASRAVADA
jgi:CRISPR system Cascade subunit CasC